MRAPRALSMVDCSHNHITKIGTSLAAHRYLARLNLASNGLKDVDGLQLCPSLVS
jgi:Leucine-rich repeat (LRR) protein